MELDRIDLPCFIGDGRIGGVLAGANDLEALRQTLRAIPVAHPDNALIGNTVEKPRLSLDFEFGLAVLMVIGRHDLSAKMLRDQLHPVADTQNRQAQIPDPFVRMIRIFGINRSRTAGEDDPFGAAGLDVCQRFAIRNHLGIDTAFTEFAGDELGVLGTEIEDENGDMFHKKPLGIGGDIIINRIIQKYSLELRGCGYLRLV